MSECILLDFVLLSSSGTSVKSKLLIGLYAMKMILSPFYCATSGAVHSPIKLVKSRNSIKKIPVVHECWPVVWTPFCFAKLRMLNSNRSGFNQLSQGSLKVFFS